MTHKEQQRINGALIDLSTVEKVLAYSEAWA